MNPQRSRVRGSALKIVDDHKTIEKVPSQAQKVQSNKDKLRENLRQRPTTTTSVATPKTTPEPKLGKTTTAQALRRSATTTIRSEQQQQQQHQKKTRYSPITR